MFYIYITLKLSKINLSSNHTKPKKGTEPPYIFRDAASTKYLKVTKLCKYVFRSILVGQLKFFV